MANIYQKQDRVRFHDVDVWGRVRAICLLQAMEEATVEAAADVGFDQEWYDNHSTAWVMRNLTLQRLGTAAYGDDLRIVTWVSNLARLKVECEYEIRQADGAPVAVGRAERVYFDRNRMRPAAIDPEIAQAWATQPPSALWHDHLIEPLGQLKEEITIPHTARLYDADGAGHTNNTVYADWLEAAAIDAFPKWGYELADFHYGADGPHPNLQRLSIAYQGATKPGETIDIATSVTGADTDRQQLAIIQEIRGGTGELRVRAESVYQIGL